MFTLNYEEYYAIKRFFNNHFVSYGNLISKSRYTPGWAARTEAFTYDPSHRYIAESWNTAYPNVKTTSTYDPVLGLPLTVANSDGFTTTYSYDAFGRVRTQADNNGRLDSTLYAEGGVINWPVNGRYVVINKSNTGAVNYDYYDKLGRQIRAGLKEFNGGYIFTDRVYNSKGQVYQESQPYLWGVLPQFITYTYDVRGRLIKEARPEGDNTLSYLIVGNNYQATATNAAGQTKVTQTDKSGKTVRVEDEGGVLTYTYHSNGGVLQTALNSNPVLINEYDAWGRRIKETDPNYGTYEYAFNGHGELYNKKDPKGNNFHFNYNRRGDMFQRGGPDGIFDLYYHYGTGPNSGKLIQINRQGSGSPLRIVYDHGMGDQLNYEARIIGSDTFKNSHTYNSYGQLNVRTFPNGRQVNYFYQGNGDLAGVLNIHPFLGPTILYMINTKNPFGQPYSITHGESLFMGYNAAETFQGYNTLGFLVSQSSTSGVSGLEIRSSTYDFDVTTGNLNERLDNTRNKKESFLFDDLNRLEKSRRENLSPPSMMPDIDLSYADNGNILSKTDAGSFSYDVANRISEIDPYVDVPEATQNLSYTGFNKVAQIEEGSKTANFSYWPDEERSKMEVADSGSVKKIKYYAPDYEKELIILPNGDTTIRELCYVTGPNGHIMAILERKDGVDKPYYTLTNYLGSITHIIDQEGNLVEERSFDAWGRRRDPDTWVPLPATWGSLTDASWDRGYTGHEHLPQFGIINMNGRLYDPVMGRMFSPDPYIMGTDNTQGYNRYTYALNNPLKYTDPDGEWVHIAIGAVVGGVVNLGVKLFQRRISSFGDGLMAFGIGAAAGAVGAATGGAAFIGAGGAAAGSGGVIAGMAGGLYGSAASMPIQSMGNTLYFGDAPLTAKEWVLGSLMGMGTGGLTNGALAALNGRNILTGKFPKVDLSKISNLTQPQPLKLDDYKITNIDSKKMNVDINGDFNKAMKEWNNIRVQYGQQPKTFSPSPSVRDGFPFELPDGSYGKASFYYGGSSNPNGYNIKINTFFRDHDFKKFGIYFRYLNE